MHQNVLRLLHSNVTLGDVPGEDKRQEILRGLESGKYELDPAFIKTADGKLQLIEVSIVRSRPRVE